MLKIRLFKGVLVRFGRCGALALLVAGAATCVSAQSAAQPAVSASAPATGSAPAAASTASTGVSTSDSKVPSPNLAAPAQVTGSPNLIAKAGPPADEINRKALEDNAGKDAASILLRSQPSGAQIFINDAFVGRTPLLLSVAPGKYKVEMRGQRDDSAERTIGLLAHDTQIIVLTLGSRYPNRVSIP